MTRELLFVFLWGKRFGRERFLWRSFNNLHFLNYQTIGVIDPCNYLGPQGFRVSFSGGMDILMMSDFGPTGSLGSALKADKSNITLQSV